VPESEPIQVVLNRVKTAIGAVGKNERNTQQGWNFRGIDAVVNAASEHLNREGVITVPKVLSYTYDTVEVGAQRKPTGHIVATVEYAFMGPSGDTINATVIAESLDSGDKGAAKVMSVAYRIALLQVLNLPTTEPDPDSETFERSAPNAQKAQTANRPNTRNTANSGNKPNTSNVEIADILAKARDADNIEALRTAYKEAGAAGVLQNVIRQGDETMKLEHYLLKRGDEIKFRNGNGSATAGRAESGNNTGAV